MPEVFVFLIVLLTNKILPFYLVFLGLSRKSRVERLRLDSLRVRRYRRDHFEITRVRKMRHVAIGLCSIGGLVAAYALGAVVHQPANESPVTTATVTQAISNVKIPEQPLKVEQALELPMLADPTKVLLGETKIPDTLLKAPPPPARPDLIGENKIGFTA